jgi:hypothetical protein
MMNNVLLICIQDYDPELPPELAAATGHPDISVDKRNKTDNGHTDFSSQGRGPASIRTPVVLSFPPPLESCLIYYGFVCVRWIITSKYWYILLSVCHILMLVFHAINPVLRFYSYLQQSKHEFISLTTIHLSMCGLDLQNQ